MLAAKASLCTRLDALGDGEDGNCELGVEHKVKLESRLRVLEEGNIKRLSGTAKAKAKFEKFHTKSEVLEYPAAADSTVQSGKRRHSEIEDKKPLIEEIEEISPQKPKKKKIKKDVQVVVEAEEEVKVEETDAPKKKKKKKKKEIKEEPED